MKRLSILSVVLFLAITVGCGGRVQQEAKTPPPENVDKTAPEDKNENDKEDQGPSRLQVTVEVDPKAKSVKALLAHFVPRSKGKKVDLETIKKTDADPNMILSLVSGDATEKVELKPDSKREVLVARESKGFTLEELTESIVFTIAEESNCNADYFPVASIAIPAPCYLVAEEGAADVKEDVFVIKKSAEEKEVGFVHRPEYTHDKKVIASQNKAKCHVMLKDGETYPTIGNVTEDNKISSDGIDLSKFKVGTFEAWIVCRQMDPELLKGDTAEALIVGIEVMTKIPGGIKIEE